MLLLSHRIALAQRKTSPGGLESISTEGSNYRQKAYQVMDKYKKNYESTSNTKPKQTISDHDMNDQWKELIEEQIPQQRVPASK
jgi:GTPase Era involved in 16S rRNA processing